MVECAQLLSPDSDSGDRQCADDRHRHPVRRRCLCLADGARGVRTTEYLHRIEQYVAKMLTQILTYGFSSKRNPTVVWLPGTCIASRTWQLSFSKRSQEVMQRLCEPHSSILINSTTTIRQSRRPMSACLWKNRCSSRSIVSVPETDPAPRSMKFYATRLRDEGHEVRYVECHELADYRRNRGVATFNGCVGRADRRPQ